MGCCGCGGGEGVRGEGRGGLHTLLFVSGSTSHIVERVFWGFSFYRVFVCIVRMRIMCCWWSMATELVALLLWSAFGGTLVYGRKQSAEGISTSIGGLVLANTAALRSYN